MSMNKTIALSSRQQLVDLNGETTNFNLTFTVTSKNNEQFDLLVVDQTTLDNNPNLEFKRANGTISGNIISDKNVYQNYFLCIKAEKPCEVDVIIDKKEIEPVLENVSRPSNFISSSDSKPLPPSRPSMTQHINQPSSTNWKMIGIVIIVIVGGIILYQMYSKNNNKKSEDSVVTHVASPKSSPVASPNSSLSSPLSQNNYSYNTYNTTNLGNNKANSSLISRLNNMPLK